MSDCSPPAKSPPIPTCTVSPLLPGVFAWPAGSRAASGVEQEDDARDGSVTKEVAEDEEVVVDVVGVVIACGS